MPDAGPGCAVHISKICRFSRVGRGGYLGKNVGSCQTQKLYTRLFNQDLNKFLSARENSYDLINAADVLLISANWAACSFCCLML